MTSSSAPVHALGGVVHRAAQRVVYSRVCGWALLYPITSWGYRRYRRTGETPAIAYRAMRKLHGNRDPSLFERMRTLATHGASPLIMDDRPPGISATEIDETVDALRRDGYAVLRRRLDDEACASLEACARRSTCSLEPHPAFPPDRQRFDDTEPRAIRYDLDEADIVGCAGAQQLLSDASLLAVAQRYLGAPPVQDLLAMWWSAAVGPPDSSAAAQQFHFDLDRLSFLKVFVYLTEVNEHTGPHVYVRGTHRDVPRQFRKDRRYSDAEVVPIFGEDIRTISGPRGTVFLADTRGLHKGQTLLDGYRLVFQTEYTTSLFGHPYSRPSIVAPTPDFVAMHSRFPSTFQRFHMEAIPESPGTVRLDEERG